MNKPNQILSIALIVQIVIGAVIFFPRSSNETVSSGALLASFTPENVTQITIHDAEGNTLTLAKTAAKWVLPNADDYPVKSDQVDGLLQKIAGLQANRLIAENSSSHKRLKVDKDEYERLIEIQSSGDETENLYIGSSAGANATHMRVNDDSNVYLTSGLASYEASTQISNWIDTLYFSVPQDELVSIKLENQNGVFEFVKDGDAWTLADLAEGETFNPESISTLLNQVAGVRMTAPLGKEAKAEYGIDEPLATITLTAEETVTPDEGDTQAPAPEESATEDPSSVLAQPTPQTVEKTYTLRLGAKLDDENYALISSESDYYVKISSFTADAYLNITREGLLQVPETPEPTPES